MNIYVDLINVKIYNRPTMKSLFGKILCEASVEKL